MSEKMPVKHWSMESAIEQIRKCGFECEGGSIESNDAWVWLCKAARKGPEFWPGQGVWAEVSATAAGQTIKQWAHFYIVGCQMTADCDRRYFTYDLSNDPPAPWHYGETHMRGVRGDLLRLEKPASAEATP